MKNMIALAAVSYIIGTAAQAQTAPAPIAPQPVTPPAVSDVPATNQQPIQVEKKAAEEATDNNKDAVPAQQSK